MAPTPSPTSEATPLWKKVLVVLPGLAVFGSFAASAVAMKIAPLYGLLPGNANKEILKAWGKFSALPQLQMVLKPLALDSKKFMLAIAIAHLIVAALLVFPSGKWGTRLAGLWAMVAMAGAEFCTRQTTYVPAGFSKEFQWLGILITSATHITLFICGAYLLFGKQQGKTVVVMLNEILNSVKKSEAPEKKEDLKEKEDRGRTAQPSLEKNKRDSTPKAKTSEKGSPPSSRGRGKGK